MSKQQRAERNVILLGLNAGSSFSARKLAGVRARKLDIEVCSSIVSVRKSHRSKGEPVTNFPPSDTRV